MGAAGALDLLEEIQALVSVKLQVVSYKWLSRNFSLSSNDAKRLLNDFVAAHGEGLGVIYALSGWLKKNPEVFNIRLVPGSKLAEAKQDLREFSVHVYSVQASIPKDPAAIWNSEFVQAEELFDQPLSVDNCLRDTRFCGVSNSFVKRVVDEKSKEPPLTKKIDVSAVVREGNGGPVGPVNHPLPDNPSSGKRKVENEKVSQVGSCQSLTNLWGRTSAKSKPAEALKADIINDVPRVSATSDGQISAQEALESISSDDEWQMVSQRESAGPVGRKRRVVLDSSDEEDEVNPVNLAQPEPSTCLSEPNLKDTEIEESILQEKPSINAFGLPSEGQNETHGEVNADGKSMVDGARDFSHENSVSTSPKRSKVLKTRIDERGREVTEVVWEGDAAEKEKADVAVVDNSSRERPPPAAKSSPAVPRHVPSAPESKPGGGRKPKAGGAKDSKQPNILSFFKKS